MLFSPLNSNDTRKGMQAMPRISIRVGALSCCLLALAGLNQAAFAQARVVAPRATATPVPPQPENAQGVPVEGWAVVRYSVLADGTADDVRIQDIVPPAADPAGAKTTVEQWRFTPAMQDGEPSGWHNNESIVLFGELEEAPGAAQEFTDAYSAIAGMIEEQEYEQARDANEKLLNELAVQTEELALTLAQATIIRIGLLDFHGALRYVRLATDTRVNLLRREDLLVSLQLRLQVEAQLGRTNDAIETYERIAAGIGPDETDPFAPMAESLYDNWNEVEILQVLARVDDHPWRFEAGRRIFTIDDVVGEIDGIEAECDHRRLTLEFQADVEWQLPDSFGECTIFVIAEPGTTFSFFEMLPE
jgi:hypothetical protein